MTLPQLRERAEWSAVLVKNIESAAEWKHVSPLVRQQWLSVSDFFLWDSPKIIAALCRALEAHRAHYELTVDFDDAVVVEADAALDALLREVDDGR